MIENNYLNTSIQKAFLPNVRGTDEHHFKLWSAFEDAKKSRHTLSACRLDFANAFSSVPHWLIQDSFKLYHASDHFLRIVNNLYSNLLSASSDKWSTSLLPCRVGVFQGDPFSVIVFNTVINTLVLQLNLEAPKIGYKFSNSFHTIKSLLFADDVTLIAKSSRDLQFLCSIGENGVNGQICLSKLESVAPSVCHLIQSFTCVTLLFQFLAS